MAPTSRQKKPTAHRRPGKTALKRPAGRGGRQKAAPAAQGGRFAVLAERPVVLAGLAVGLLAGGIGIGYLMGDGAAGPRPGQAAPAAVTASTLPATTGGVRRAESIVLETRLRDAQAAPDHQDGSVYPPDIALPGVRITDRPEVTGESRQIAALPPLRPSATEALEPPAAVAPAPAPSDETTQPPWLRHAVAVPDAEGKPMVAIVIDDMGVDQRRSAEVTALPGPLTTSFLTYAPGGPAQAEKARRQGHELMIHVPMEPSSASIDPGPGALRAGMEAATITQRLDEGLSAYSGFVGINNHMGSKFTADAESLKPVIAALKARGLLWLDSRTTAKSAGARLATAAGVPFAERHVFLDHQNSLDGVREQLGKVEAVARKYGYAIAIGHPKDHTIAGLREWLPTLERKGVVLVPVSTIVKARMEASGSPARTATR